MICQENLSNGILCFAVSGRTIVKFSSEPRSILYKWMFETVYWIYSRVIIRWILIAKHGQNEIGTGSSTWRDTTNGRHDKGFCVCIYSRCTRQRTTIGHPLLGQTENDIFSNVLMLKRKDRPHRQTIWYTNDATLDFTNVPMYSLKQKNAKTMRFRFTSRASEIKFG